MMLGMHGFFFPPRTERLWIAPARVQGQRVGMTGKQVMERRGTPLGSACQSSDHLPDEESECGRRIPVRMDLCLSLS